MPDQPTFSKIPNLIFFLSVNDKYTHAHTKVQYVRTSLLILIAMAGYVHDGAAKASVPERLHEELLPLDLDVGVVLAEVEPRSEVSFAGAAAHLQAILVRNPPPEPAVV